MSFEVFTAVKMFWVSHIGYNTMSYEWATNMSKEHPASTSSESTVIHLQDNMVSQLRRKQSDYSVTELVTGTVSFAGSMFMYQWLHCWLSWLDVEATDSSAWVCSHKISLENRMWHMMQNWFFCMIFLFHQLYYYSLLCLIRMYINKIMLEYCIIKKGHHNGNIPDFHSGGTHLQFRPWMNYYG